MAHLPADTLRNRTFLGLLIAQFLAAFNDQAIHASAMFFAINRKTMTDAQAISLMPILFYAPWALFVTLAGYFADRYSKRSSLVFWKLAEVGIMLVATLGFWLGVSGWRGGPWLVLSCVFLMGMHSAFFVPAKYGAMPEILQPQLLSRGNGILESLSFLAVILGTVAGGLLSDAFDDYNQQYYIGLILLGLAVIGAVASLMIQPIPAANRHRPFPRYVYGPLVDSLRRLLKSRPLALAVIGIAFFTFMVAFMRATVYMLGESQNPHWSESQTSIIVGTTALGIGLGSPLAGWLSGRKVELGLIPLGALGMALAAGCAAWWIDYLPGLVASIIAIGFFTGFYLVPLFTLLQHRAPKTSKGDAVATSNFINVTGAILASVLFFALTFAFQRLGLAQRIEPHDNYARGVLTDIHHTEGRITRIAVEGEDGRTTAIPPPGRDGVIEITRGIPPVVDPDEPTAVIVSHYFKKVHHYLVRTADERLEPVYDNSHLPRYLFVGAGLMSLGTLGLLWIQMPDLFARAAWVLRSLRQTRLHVVGTVHLPTDGPVVLVTNCRGNGACRSVVAATDRPVSLVRTKLSEERLGEAIREVQSGYVLALAAEAAELLPALQERLAATYLPVYYGPVLAEGDGPVPGGPLRVAFGPPLSDGAAPEEVHAAIHQAGAMSEKEEE
jgi:MFS family permease